MRWGEFHPPRAALSAIRRHRRGRREGGEADRPAQAGAPKGLCKNYFRFWRERRRARCEAQGRECIPSDTRPTEQRSKWPGAAPPRRAGGLGRAGFVAPRSQTARVCSLVAPCQPAQSPPAKSEFIFAQTLPRPESDIASGGHVVDTLTVSLWCLLTSRGYTETVLKAVNLGGDTDMTGVARLGKHNLPAAAGGRLDGLAGVERRDQGNNRLSPQSKKRPHGSKIWASARSKRRRSPSAIRGCCTGCCTWPARRGSRNTPSWAHRGRASRWSRCCKSHRRPRRLFLGDARRGGAGFDGAVAGSADRV
ncbi:MAG: ADP-ribosylglycohydrolase family protein [Verrucomicrobia bacterium]|nr:ADP-ribosylglycohydrolase family protein [Verrucomicrobiota bacterium]